MNVEELAKLLSPNPGLCTKAQGVASAAHRNDHSSYTTHTEMTLAGLETAIFGSEDQRLIH